MINPFELFNCVWLASQESVSSLFVPDIEAQSIINAPLVAGVIETVAPNGVSSISTFDAVWSSGTELTPVKDDELPAA